MIELDGPKKAWFEEPDGTRHTYTVYAIGAKTEWECMQAYVQWLYAYNEPDKILVWRRRPELVHQEAYDDLPEFWKISCRCVKIPIKYVGNPLVEKPEGMQVQMV